MKDVVSFLIPSILLPWSLKYNKVTSLTVADVCMFYFEIEVSQTQSRNKSQNHIHYLPEIDPMPI